MTAFAALAARNLNHRFSSGGRLLEADLEVVAEIGAALRPAATTAAAEAEQVAEAPEDVVELGKDRGVEARRSRAAARDGGVPETIVARSLVSVRKNGIGLGRLLERLLRPALVRVAKAT